MVMNLQVSKDLKFFYRLKQIYIFRIRHHYGGSEFGCLLIGCVPCLISNPWHKNRESEIMDMHYVNLFTPVPLPCSALTVAWKLSCGDHSIWIVWGVYIAKIRFGAGGKILSRSVLRRGQRVRAGSTCYICVLLVHLCVIKGQIYIYFLLYHEASTQ
jgi:hypothetical protein